MFLAHPPPGHPEELEQAVSHAFRFDDRKQFKLAGEIMGKMYPYAKGRLVGR